MIIPWIDELPTTGEAWWGLKKVADSQFDTAKLSTRNQHNIQVLANAYVGRRTKDRFYINRVKSELERLMATTPDIDDILGSCRRLGTYAIAFDVADFQNTDPIFASTFKYWAWNELRRNYTGGGPGGTIISIHEGRPNNWQHAGTSRIAVDLAIRDKEDLEKAIQVHKGLLGDRTSYASFKFGDLSWQADPQNPVGINPKGATLKGHDVDGVIPDDLRQGNESGDPKGFVWPPPSSQEADGIMYSYGMLEALSVSTMLLCSAGYDAHLWSDKALLRAFKWLNDVAQSPIVGDDVFEAYLVKYFYPDATFIQLPQSPIRIGKNFAFTDWTHSNRALQQNPPPSDDCELLRQENARLTTIIANLLDKVTVLESSLLGSQSQITVLKDDINILSGRNINLQTRLAEIKALATL
jgi:hypothetical protein